MNHRWRESGIIRGEYPSPMWRPNIGSLHFISFALVLLASPLTSASIGAQIGDYASWSCNTTVSPAPATDASEALALMLSVSSVEARVPWIRPGTEVITCELTARSKAGAARTVRLVQDLSRGDITSQMSAVSREGIPGLGLFLARSDLTTGDPLAVWWRNRTWNLTVQETRTARYAGAAREVYISQQERVEETGVHSIEGQWDRATGILCHAHLSHIQGNQTVTTTIQITETNRWGIVRGSRLPLFAFLIGLGSVIALAMHRRRKAKKST